jgi:hypothetical protein
MPPEAYTCPPSVPLPPLLSRNGTPRGDQGRLETQDLRLETRGKLQTPPPLHCSLTRALGGGRSPWTNANTRGAQVRAPAGPRAEAPHPALRLPWYQLRLRGPAGRGAPRHSRRAAPRSWSHSDLSHSPLEPFAPRRAAPVRRRRAAGSGRLRARGGGAAPGGGAPRLLSYRRPRACRRQSASGSAWRS